MMRLLSDPINTIERTVREITFASEIDFLIALLDNSLI